MILNMISAAPFTKRKFNSEALDVVKFFKVKHRPAIIACAWPLPQLSIKPLHLLITAAEHQIPHIRHINHCCRHSRHIPLCIPIHCVLLRLG
jgi:hypothetical protein